MTDNSVAELILYCHALQEGIAKYYMVYLRPSTYFTFKINPLLYKDLTINHSIKIPFPKQEINSKYVHPLKTHGLEFFNFLSFLDSITKQQNSDYNSAKNVHPNAILTSLIKSEINHFCAEF